MRETRSPIICFVACIAVFGVAIYMYQRPEFTVLQKRKNE